MTDIFYGEDVVSAVLRQHHTRGIERDTGIDLDAKGAPSLWKKDFYSSTFHCHSGLPGRL